MEVIQTLWIIAVIALGWPRKWLLNACGYIDFQCVTLYTAYVQGRKQCMSVTSVCRSI